MRWRLLLELDAIKEDAMPRWETLLEDRPLDRDPARSLTLPSHLYTSPEIFAREREAIFFKSWHRASTLASPIGKTQAGTRDPIYCDH